MSKDSSVSTILYQPSPQQLDKVRYNQIGEVGLVSLSLLFQTKGEVDLLYTGRACVALTLTFTFHFQSKGEVDLLAPQLSITFTFNHLHFQSKGEVDLLAGLVWLSPPVAESLLKLHSLPPVDACTYIGADSGGKAQNTKFSLSQFSPKGPCHLPLL